MNVDHETHAHSSAAVTSTSGGVSEDRKRIVKRDSSYDSEGDDSRRRKEKSRDRDYDRDRESRSHRDRDRDRDEQYRKKRSRSRENKSAPTEVGVDDSELPLARGERRSSQDRDRDRDKDSRRHREAGRSRDRDRYERRQDSRDRDRHRERDRNRHSSSSRRARSMSRSRSPSHGARDKSSYEPVSTASAAVGGEVYRPMTLKEVMLKYPGISVPDAVHRMNAHNAAAARASSAAPAPVPAAPALVPPAAVAYGSGAPPLPPGPTPPAAGYPGYNSYPLQPPQPSLGLGGLPVALPGAVVGEGGPDTKPHRELYIGNLPPGITTPQLAEFMNAALHQLGVCQAGENVVVSGWVSPDGHFAFCELKSMQLATTALTHLNGIQVGAFGLKIGRPKGYNPMAAPVVSSLPVSNPLVPNPLMVGVAGAAVVGAGATGSAVVGAGEAMSHVLMVSNLPPMIVEDQIMELFLAFGDIKARNLIRSSTGALQSVVLEYKEHALADGVVEGMNKLDVAGYKLSVQRIPVSSAAVLLKPSAAAVAAIVSSAATSAAAAAAAVCVRRSLPVDSAILSPVSEEPTRVLRMLNMTSEEDLTDDQMYSELIEDVEEECNTHGRVESIVVPREPADVQPARGHIFVQFNSVDGAEKTKKAVQGRKFAGKLVVTSYYPEELFTQQCYSIPENWTPGSLVTSRTDERAAEMQPSAPTESAVPIISTNAPMEDLD